MTERPSIEISTNGNSFSREIGRLAQSSRMNIEENMKPIRTSHVRQFSMTFQ